MSFPTQILPDHHRHCDDLFVAAEDAVQRADWTAAAAAFMRFHGQMTAHFEAEEGLLFPAFEAATGMSAGPTQMMRHEHEQMRGLLAQLTAACEGHDGESYAGAAETLLMLMQQHNMKEENILYPMCDQALGAEAERIGAKMEATLEKSMPEPRVIDGRDMEPPEPLELAVAELGKLAPGEELIMLLNCEPLPLYAILDSNGFSHRATLRADGSNEVRIMKKPGART